MSEMPPAARLRGRRAPRPRREWRATTSTRSADDATAYWRRRASRAEGTREQAVREQLGPAAARLLEAAVRLGEARYAGDLSVRKGKAKLNMGKVWNEFRAALTEYAGTPDGQYVAGEDEE